MKVKIGDLKPNPYRNFEVYPIDQSKVDALKRGIISTGFDENIVGRKDNGEIEIAYGHHRLEALRQLADTAAHEEWTWDTEINIQGQSMDDKVMLKKMIEENGIEYKIQTVQMIDDGVLAVWNFLGGYATCELRKQHGKPDIFLFKDRERPIAGHYKYSILAKQIQGFIPQGDGNFASEGMKGLTGMVHIPKGDVRKAWNRAKFPRWGN